MSGQIGKKVKGEAQEEALAFLDQAQQFYAAAGEYTSTNPLLYYYAFLNLAKSLMRVRGFTGSLERAYHGLKNEHPGDGNDPKDFQVSVQGSRKKRVNIFTELSYRLGNGRPAQTTYSVEELMSQVVVGHRLWREAARKSERFLALYDVEIMQDTHKSKMWMQLNMKREIIDRFGISHKKVLKEGDLKEKFCEVKGDEIPEGCVAFEQKEPVKYGQRPNEELIGLVDPLRDRIWQIVSSDPDGGYRKYYLHMTPEDKLRLPQISSLWALLFHYGSIVRYQPHMFKAMTMGKYGAFIQEFVAAQPEQLLYLLASEMCQREVVKPAIA